MLNMKSRSISTDWWQLALDGLREFDVDVEVIPVAAQSQSGERTIDVTVQGKRARLCIELKAHGYPRDMRNYAAHVAASDSPQDDCIRVVAVPYITKAAKEFLRSRGMSYLDGTGSFYLTLPDTTLIVETYGRPPLVPGRKSLFRPVSSQVLHALLIEPDRVWKVADLAVASKASPGTVHAVVTELERIGWMDRAGSGPRTLRTLIEPGELLDAWAVGHTLSDYQWQRFHLWKQQLDVTRNSVIDALDRSSILYSLTLSSGAELVSPGATSDRVLYSLIFEGGQLAESMVGMGARSVDEGGNICCLVTNSRSPFLFTRSIAHATIASNIQLYLDLWAWPRRGKEQAMRLREEQIGF